MSVERSPTRSDGLDHGQAAELCLGNTAELGVTERGVEGERLFQIGDPEPEVQHAHVRQTRPTTPRRSTHPQAGPLRTLLFELLIEPSTPKVTCTDRFVRALAVRTRSPTRRRIASPGSA